MKRPSALLAAGVLLCGNAAAETVRRPSNWVFHRRQSSGAYQAMLEQALEWPQHVINAYADNMRSIDSCVRASTACRDGCSSPYSDIVASAWPRIVRKRMTSFI